MAWWFPLALTERWWVGLLYIASTCTQSDSSRYVYSYCPRDGAVRKFKREAAAKITVQLLCQHISAPKGYALQN